MRNSTPIAAEVQYRPFDGDGDAWVLKRFEIGQDIVIDELIRGVSYEINIRYVAANGRSSDWVPALTTVADTNRIGAAALPNIGNQQSMWDLDTSVTFAASSTIEGASVATISVTAGDLVIGSQTVSYGASSGTITGTAGQQIVVYLYYDDPFLQGGTRTLGITTNIVESANVNGRVAISNINLTFPAAGGSSTGGGSIGGGGGSGGAKNPAANQVIE